MKAQRFQQVSEVFEAARLQPQGERETYIRGRCLDEEVVDEVLALLRHHGDASGPLDAPLLGDTDPSAALMQLDERRRSAGAMRVIGHYRLLRVLGEGGMGVVYLAEQDRPRRTVALKVMRSALASRRMLRRFEFEASVLGMLNHPGIAHIYEAGVHDGGEGLQPFFAMEYVQGVPLSTHVRERALGTTQRLEIIARVCDAVQHAHQRGVIHRDLKPGNVLIDQTGRPKVLDFGVARATDSDVQATTLVSDIGQLVGTLPYMSPEQVSGDASLLDTRSDVYSLGVMLYELLASRLPHDLKGKTLAEAARVIGEDEPMPLSSMHRVFRGDLQTIVSRALEKDKERRYASASDLAADIRRFLRDEPIEAKRDSMTYMLRKRLRRYRMLVAAGVVFAVGLATFAGYAIAQARTQSNLVWRERQAREAAELARGKAAVAERLAAEQRDHAQRARDAEFLRSQQAQSVTTFLVRMLGMTNPDISQTADMTKEAMLANASREVDMAFPNQPEAEAAVRAVIGQAYVALGQPEPAADHLWQALRLRRSLPVRDPLGEYDVLWPYVQALDDLQDPSGQRRRGEATQLAIEIVAQRLPEASGMLHEISDDLIGRTDVARVTDRYHALLALARASLAPEDPLWTPLADLLHSFSIRMRRRGLPDIGLDALETSLETHRRILGETNTRVVRVSSDLLDEMLRDRRIEEATRFAQGSLESLRQVLPEDHWYLAVMRFRLGTCLAADGRAEEANTLMRNALPRIIADRGIGSDQSVLRLGEMVLFLEEFGEPDETEEMRAEYARARAASIRATVITTVPHMLGPGFERELAAVRALQDAVGRRQDDVEQRFETLMRAWNSRIGDLDPRTAFVSDFLTAMSERVVNTRGLEGTEVARRMLLEAVRIDETANLRHPRRQALTRLWLSRVAELRGEFIDGERWAHEAMNILESGPVERFGMIAHAHSLLGGCLARQNRLEEAESLLIEGYEGLCDDIGPLDRNAAIALDRVIALYEAMNRPEDASRWRQTAIEQQMNVTPASADRLNVAAWQVVRRMQQGPDAYAAALAAAERAVKLAPRRASYVNTLAAAQYRTGDLEKALATLRHSIELSNGEQFEDFAFLSLIHRAMGAEALANAARDRFLAFEEKIQLASREDYADLLAEVVRVSGRTDSPSAEQAPASEGIPPQ